MAWRPPHNPLCQILTEKEWNQNHASCATVDRYRGNPRVQAQTAQELKSALESVALPAPLNVREIVQTNTKCL